MTATAATSEMTPPREYVSSTVRIATVSPAAATGSAQGRGGWAPASHRRPGTAKTAISARAFQYPRGAARRARSPSAPSWPGRILLPRARATGSAAAALRPSPSSRGASGSSAPSASPRARAQRAIACRLASIQARSGAPAHRIDRAAQAVRPPIAASARRLGTARRASRSHASTTAAAARGAPRARARKAARGPAPPRPSPGSMPPPPTHTRLHPASAIAPMTAGAPGRAGRAAGRACPPSGPPLRSATPWGPTPPVSLTGWLPCSDVPPG